MADFRVDVTIPPQTRYLGLVGSIGEQVANVLEPFHGDRAELAFSLNIVLTEAVTNAIEHTPAHPVRIRIRFHKNELSIQVYDHGAGFRLNEVPTPNLDQPREGGLGVFLMQTLMDSVDYRRTENGNVLEMKMNFR